MTDGKRTLIDSNILVYSIDRSEEEKHERAKKLFNELLEDEKLFLSVQNLTEFYSVSTRKIEDKLDHEEAMRMINNLKNIKEVEIDNLNINNLSKGAKIAEQNQTDYWDSLIAAVMKENNVEKIYTENTKDFENIPSIEPENPFKQ